MSEDTPKVPEQEALSVLVVTEVLSIASEKVTVMLSVIATELWLSAVVEIEDTVGAVVSVVEEPPEDVAELAVVSHSSSDSAHEETSTAMLTIRTNQDNIIFILLLKYKMLKK